MNKAKLNKEIEATNKLIDEVIENKKAYGYLPKDFSLKNSSRVRLANLTYHNKLLTEKQLVISFFVTGYYEGTNHNIKEEFDN